MGTITNTNVPACVGRPCTPGQAQYLFEGDYDYVAEHMATEGYECTTEILSVYTPHYDPFYGTFDIADLENNPQFNEIVIDEEETNDQEDNVAKPVLPKTDPPLTIFEASGDSEEVPQNPPTLAPVSNLRSPKYGALFQTAAPTIGWEEPLSAGFYTRTTTVLVLLLPMAVSSVLVLV